MDRRGFLKALGVSAVVAVAPFPLRYTAEAVTQAQAEKIHEARIHALARSMHRTKEEITANVLERAFGGLP